MRIASSLAAASATVALLSAGIPAMAAPAPVPPAAPGDVLIDEIAASGSRALSDGFFELRNTTDHAVDLSGFFVFRCDDEGLRAKASRPDADLRDVVLAPGQIYAVAHMSAHEIDADSRFAQAIDPAGFGLVLIDRTGATVDSVAVYPNAPIATDSECGDGPNLPVTLAAALDESWQRTASGEWVRARATPSMPNATSADPTGDARVRIDEIAPAGPAGHGDDITEVLNTAQRPIDVGGWRLYRCTSAGVLTAETLQYEFASGEWMDPGQRFVIGGPQFTGRADARAATSLADRMSGVLLVDATGRRVDGLTVSSDADSACQDGEDKLPAALDYRTGESWQRTKGGHFVVAARTPGDDNAGRARAAVALADEVERAVAISEIATDPQLPGEASRRNFVELANYSDRSVDVSGWRLVACGANGFRRFDTLATLGSGVRLEPGGTWLAALRGTTETARAGAVYDVPLAVAGAGAWLEDAKGRRVDSAGIYHRNEMDAGNQQSSACTNGLALSTFAVDRLRSETFQRTAFSGDDASDFSPAPATPGEIAPLADTSVQALADEARALAATAVTAVRPAAATSGSPPVGARPVSVREAVAGSSAGALVGWDAPGEEVVDATAPRARDEAYEHPYVRLRVAAPSAGAVLGWSGRVVGRAAVRLSVWDPEAAGWRTLDERAGAEVAPADGAADAAVRLQGRVLAGEVADGTATLLVQSLPRTSMLDGGPELGDPGDYDLALSHLTDTQYYSEAYPEVYAAEVGWIAANAAARRIAFTTHTGDLVQNWVDPDQVEERARREFETASTMQAVLDDAGVPNSVLPGNHDSKRGITYDLFNEYFGPGRYNGKPWWGGSIAPDDNRAGYATVTAAGAKFLMLTLPYGYGEEEVAYAESVVAQHPEHNVVVSTHEHLTPKSQTSVAARSNSSRWLSHADLLWDRVIAPHRNVVLVLSGHFHGIGAIVTEDAGGIAGHTVVEALADYQEFRTHTGERATGFQRLLQLDLAGGRLAADTFSVPLRADASHPYDYRQFVPVDGHERTPSNEQPWNIVGEGLQHRYTEVDDAFTVDLALQYAKAVETDEVWVDPGASR